MILKIASTLLQFGSKSIGFGRSARYLLALGFLVLAVLVRMALEPWLGDTLTHATVFTAVLFAAWCCGSGPAALIAVLGYPAVQYFLVDASPRLASEPSYLVSNLLLHAGLAAVIIFFMAILRLEHNTLKATQARLKESEQQFRASFDNAALGIYVVDAQDRLLSANERMCQILGYTREELLGKPVEEITAPEDRQAGEDLAKALHQGLLERFDLEKRCLRRDGSRHWVRVTASAVRNDSGRLLYSIRTVEDITERKRAEELLRTATLSAERAKIVAVEASEAKDRFLAVLSHELRTPLTPVLAAVQLVQRRKNLSEDLRQPLDIIARNVQLEARLIDDLLDLTRIVQGKIVLDRKPINLCTVIERAIETSRPDIDARKLHFGVELEDRPLQVDGDASRLQQVVWNLLINAVKFTPDGGCVGVRCRCEDEKAILEVTDSGIGIEPEAATRIFDAFEQGSRAVTRQFGGLGLGLAIAKRLVELHGGTISAHSKGRNEGATFRIALPLSTSEPAPVPQTPAAVPTEPPRRILLVEDNGDTAIIMKMLLEAFGYSVETAGDVTQALKLIAARDFDLLVSDLGLPDQSGLELMQELRRQGNSLKGIALSGYGQEEDVRRSREAGFSLHVTKPVDADALVTAVARVI